MKPLDPVKFVTELPRFRSGSVHEASFSALFVRALLTPHRS
jgi:hypothetical protein